MNSILKSFIIWDLDFTYGIEKVSHCIYEGGFFLLIGIVYMRTKPKKGGVSSWNGVFIYHFKPSCSEIQLPDFFARTSSGLLYHVHAGVNLGYEGFRAYVTVMINSNFDAWKGMGVREYGRSNGISLTVIFLLYAKYLPECRGRNWKTNNTRNSMY